MSESGQASHQHGSIVVADGDPLDLRNRELAAFLAWLIPGAGHFYQRRYLKSAIFSISILSTFVLGMLVSGNRCVYAAWNRVDSRWQYVLQAGVGLPAMPAAYQAYRVRNGLPLAFRGFMAPPESINDLSDWNAETSSGFDMGTLYTMIAGLLNILVIFDAWGGPLPPPAKPERNRKEPDGDGGSTGGDHARPVTQSSIEANTPTSSQGT